MSHIARLFVTGPLTAEMPCELGIDQSRYLLRVMRLEAGASVRVFNGYDGEWLCQLEVKGKTAHLIPEQQLRAHSLSPDLTLLFAPLKKTRTDFAVEKATELGARRLQPVITEYTQTSRVRTDRLRQLAIEAAEQTERMDIPDILEPDSLFNVLDQWDGTRPLYYCDEGGERVQALAGQIEQGTPKGAILVGPEGGFSDAERQRLKRYSFVYPITLGPRILRAETAIVSALTLWQSALGDWGEPPYLRT